MACVGPAALGKGGGGGAPSVTLCEAQLPSDLRPSLSTSGSAAARDLGRLPGAFPLPLLPNREGPGVQGVQARLSTKPQAFPLGHRLPIRKVPILLQTVPRHLPHPEGNREGCSASTAHISLLPAVGLCVSGLTSLNLCLLHYDPPITMALSPQHWQDGMSWGFPHTQHGARQP